MRWGRRERCSQTGGAKGKGSEKMSADRDSEGIVRRKWDKSDSQERGYSSQNR